MTGITGRNEQNRSIKRSNNEFDTVMTYRNPLLISRAMLTHDGGPLVELCFASFD